MKESNGRDIVLASKAASWVIIMAIRYISFEREGRGGWGKKGGGRKMRGWELKLHNVRREAAPEA